MSCEVVPAWRHPGTEVELIKSGKTEEYISKFTESMGGEWKFPEMVMPWESEKYKGTDGLYRCPEAKCADNAEYESGRDLRRHAKKHFKPVLCPAGDCGQDRTAEQKEMKRHFREIHASHTIQKPCCPVPGCGSCFVRSESVNRHVLQQHPGFAKEG